MERSFLPCGVHHAQRQLQFRLAVLPHREFRFFLRHIHHLTDDMAVCAQTMRAQNIHHRGGVVFANL